MQIPAEKQQDDKTLNEILLILRDYSDKFT